MDQLDEIVREFLVESYENLDELDQRLLELEECPDDRDQLAGIFRTIHTIKGTSGFLAFPNLEHITHVGENLLVPLRDGQFSMTNDIANALLSMVDAVRTILRNIESSGVEGDETYESLCQQLEALKDGGGALSADSSSATEICTSETTAASESTSEIPATEETITPVPEEFPAATDTVQVDAPTELPPVIAETPPEPAKQQPAPTSAATPKASFSKRAESSDTAATVADASVRIDVHILDRLMNLVGELVLARNQILQFSRSSEDSAIIAASQRLNLITSELQEGVMQTRMQPIRNVWSKLPRVVRDLAAACGKKVRVEMEGASTDLDKTILEAIKDPLTHIVRNSVDHGIEKPEVRAERGKNEEGLLLLRAYHEGGQVIIEIVDDGGGINIDRVKEKAIGNGMITEAQAAEMSDRELTNLIMLPGFSTAAAVTNVSGRGVGMDVVKTNVEKIGGTLEILSAFGEGTTMRVKIPLTLAIVPALIVTCQEHKYAIPQISLVELVRVDCTPDNNPIELIDQTPVYRLRGKLLPIVGLKTVLGLSHSKCPKNICEELGQSEAINIVVLQVEDRHFGLVVDQVTDTQEIVVKPLGGHVKSVTVFAGATIMGDGSVSLILDVNGIAHSSGVLTESGGGQNNENREHLNAARLASETLLIVDSGDGTRTSIPLRSIARLEDISESDIRISCGQEVIQYRDSIMPLVRLNNHLSGNGSVEQRFDVVVYEKDGMSFGVIVGQILDIVDQPFEGNKPRTRSRIINEQITDAVDLDSLVSQYQHFYTGV
ncbi:MAG: chemotaxis protein CheA [Pirellulaceae bacterium]